MSSHERDKTFYGRDVWETGVNDYKVSYLTMQNSVDAGTNLADNVLGSRRRSCTSSAVFFFEGRATGPILLTGCNRISKKRTPATGQVSQAQTDSRRPHTLEVHMTSLPRHAAIQAIPTSYNGHDDRSVLETAHA